MKEKIILVGGGGHCKSCIDVIEQENRYQIAGIIDLQEKLNETILNYQILATDDNLPEIAAKYDNFLITFGQIKTPDKRIELFNKLKKLGGKFPVITSPLAYVSKHAKVGEGTVIMHNALVNADAKIGKNCIINTKALIEHEAVIGDHCHIATNAVINGGSRVGTGTFIGSNAMTPESINIGNERSIFLPNIETPIKIGVFGASGFSREVVDILLFNYVDKLVYIDVVFDENMYFGLPIVSEELIPQLVKEGYSFVIGIGDNNIRKKIYQRYEQLYFPNIIHPTASLGYKQLENLKTKKGNIITAGTRFTNNIEIGDFGIYNLNCTIGHDCIIKDFVSIAPGANISGNVMIEEGVYIGTNATVLQGKSIAKKIIIGKFSTVGAGAVAIQDVTENAIVVGIPAKQIGKN